MTVAGPVTPALAMDQLEENTCITSNHFLGEAPTSRTYTVWTVRCVHVFLPPKHDSAASREDLIVRVSNRLQYTNKGLGRQIAWGAFISLREGQQVERQVRAMEIARQVEASV